MKEEKLHQDKIKSVLVIMLGGIGNLILLVPALRALRKSLPQTKITLMTGEPNIEAVIDGESLVDEVILHDRRCRQNIFSQIKFIRSMRQRKFDAAIASSATNAFKGGLLTLLMGIKHRIGENVKGMGFFYTVKLPHNDRIHETTGALSLIKAIGLNIDQELPSLNISEEERAQAVTFLTNSGYKPGETLVGLHAGSGYKQTFKRWPKERFIELANTLIRECGVRIVLTGGPDEVELAGEMAAGISAPVMNAAGKLTIRQSAALIKECHLFVSNDSGLAHIASAVKAPTIVLFGPTNVYRIAPKGKNVSIIKKESMSSISVKEVTEMVIEKIKG